MLPFLNNYKKSILILIAYLLLVFLFVPIQRNYYLEEDLKDFRSNQFLRFMVVVSVLIILVRLIFQLIRKKSFLAIVRSTVESTFFVGSYALIFHTIILSLALLINRQVQAGKGMVAYQVKFIQGASLSKENMSLVDETTRHISNDQRLIDRVYSPTLKENEVVTLPCRIGLLGIRFLQVPFK